MIIYDCFNRKEFVVKAFGDSWEKNHQIIKVYPFFILPHYMFVKIFFSDFIIKYKL